MPDSPQAIANFPDTIERLLLHNEPDCSVDLCLFRLRIRSDSGQIAVRILPSEEDARAIFASDGNKFVAPVLHTRMRRADGTVTAGSPAEFEPPIVSSETLPALGHENYIWRGYGNNTRGVLKLRVGRFIADLNTPTIEDAERLARHLVELLRVG
jgi:hypothetical protein